MKLTIPSKTLKETLAKCSLIPKKATLPILSCVKITSADDLRFCVTDLTQTLITKCEGEIESQGVAVVSLVRLKNFVDYCSGDVTIYIDGKSLVAQDASSKATLALAVEEEFPQLPKQKSESSIKIDGAEFCEAIRKTLPATFKETGRPILENICWRGNTMLATDGRMVHIFEVSKEAKSDILLHRNSCGALLNIFEKSESLNVISSQNHVTIHDDKSSLCSVLMEGAFMSQGRINSATSRNWIPVELETERFKEIMGMMASSGRFPLVVSCSLSKTGMSFKCSNSDELELKSDIDCKTKFAGQEVNFDPSKAISSIGAIDGNKIEFSISDEAFISSIKIQDGKFTSLIATMRIQ